MSRDPLHKTILEFGRDSRCYEYGYVYKPHLEFQRLKHYFDLEPFKQ